MKQRIIALALALLFLLLPGACAASASSVDLMKGIKPNKVNTEADLTGHGAVAATDFGVRLFRESMAGDESSLVSPISVLCALAMTANGAVGATRTQMEEVLGMSVEDLNCYLHTYLNHLPANGERYRLSIANAIWFSDAESFTVNEAFLQANADYYGAGIYKAPFDSKTCKDINSWVSDHTEGIIDGIVGELPEDTVMCLVNAMAFDAEWNTIYNERSVKEGIFTTEPGVEQQGEFMNCTLYAYLEDDLATGFVKEYTAGKYAFVAMLPKEGVSMAEYIASLSGEHLQTLLAAPQKIKTYTSLPKFSTESETDLAMALQAMGMELPFIKGMEGVGTSTEDICMAISRALHKTVITVDEKGTKAGAASAIMMEPTSAPAPDEYRTVYLDRPFLYLIVDTKTNIPLFIGTVMGMESE